MLRSFVLYTALFAGAIATPVAAGPSTEGADATQAGETLAAGLPQSGPLAGLLDGDPKAAPDIGFSDLEGGTHHLSDYAGKALLVNFWATWCAPCREEMPSLDALQAQMGGDDFQVLTIAAGRNAPRAIRKFFEDEGVENLPMMTDAKLEMARAFGVMGMPVTVLIDAQGRERGRLIGTADWAGPDAIATITALIAP